MLAYLVTRPHSRLELRRRSAFLHWKCRAGQRWICSTTFWRSWHSTCTRIQHGVAEREQNLCSFQILCNHSEIKKAQDMEWNYIGAMLIRNSNGGRSKKRNFLLIKESNLRDIQLYTASSSAVMTRTDDRLPAKTFGKKLLLDFVVPRSYIKSRPSCAPLGHSAIAGESPGWDEVTTPASKTCEELLYQFIGLT